MNDLTQKPSANFDLSAIDFLELSDPFYRDDKPSDKNGQKFIVFYLDTDMYAIPAKDVLEIFRPLDITPLPHFPNWLVGISNFRNDVISVIDLQRLWKKDITLFAPKPKLIVLRPTTGQLPVALSVDRLSELVALPDETIEALADHVIPHVYGRVTHKSNNVLLIDTKKLVSALSF